MNTIGNYKVNISKINNGVLLEIYTSDNMLIETLKIPEDNVKWIVLNHICNISNDYTDGGTFVDLPLFNPTFHYKVYVNNIDDGAYIKLLLYKLKINTGEEVLKVKCKATFMEYHNFINELSRIIHY